MLYLPKTFAKDKRSSLLYFNTSDNEKFYNIDTMGLYYKTFYGLCKSQLSNVLWYRPLKILLVQDSERLEDL